MLKRNIAILIAGGLLSAQAGLAVAENAGSWNMPPAQAKYFAEREAANPNPTGAPGGASSPQGSVGDQGTVTLSPAQAKYFAERERNIIVARAPGSVFPQGCMESTPE